MMEMPQSLVPKNCATNLFVHYNMFFVYEIQGKTFAFHLNIEHLSTFWVFNHAIFFFKQHLITFFEQLRNTLKVLTNFRDI